MRDTAEDTAAAVDDSGPPVTIPDDYRARVEAVLATPEGRGLRSQQIADRTGVPVRFVSMIQQERGPLGSRPIARPRPDPFTMTPDAIEHEITANLAERDDITARFARASARFVEGGETSKTLRALEERVADLRRALPVMRQVEADRAAERKRTRDIEYIRTFEDVAERFNQEPGAAAAALDAWIEQGRVLVEVYRSVVDQLTPQVIEPAKKAPNFEKHLWSIASLRDRLDLSELLGERLRIAGLLPGALPAVVRERSSTLEAHVRVMAARLVDAGRRHLPTLQEDEGFT